MCEQVSEQVESKVSTSPAGQARVSCTLFFSPGSYTDSQWAMSLMFDGLEMVAQTRKGAELDVAEPKIGTPTKVFTIM